MLHLGTSLWHLVSWTEKLWLHWWCKTWVALSFWHHRRCTTTWEGTDHVCGRLYRATGRRRGRGEILEVEGTGNRASLFKIQVLSFISFTFLKINIIFKGKKFRMLYDFLHNKPCSKKYRRALHMPEI